MDAHRFDRLAISLSRINTRRGLLQLLSVFVPAVSLAAVLDEESEAARRRGNRRDRVHDQGKKKKKKHKKKRTCDTADVVCAGKCGTVSSNCGESFECGACPSCDGADVVCPGQCGIVSNNCGEQFDCGPCTCSPACLDCQSCNSVNGTCANQSGVCCTGGRCEAGICQPCLVNLHCASGACVCGDTGGPCGGATPDCCGAPGTCVDTEADPNNCGECGNACDPGEVCFHGVCTCQVCPHNQACPYHAIQDAVDAAAPGDTIAICNGFYDEFDAIMTINTNNLTLIGRGLNTSLNGYPFGPDDLGPLVHIMPGITATMKSMGLDGGLADNGGNVFNEGTLTITDCIVDNGEAHQNGGGIFNAATGNLTLINTEVTFNFANEGGGIYNAVGGSVTLSGSTTVHDNDPDNCFPTGSITGCSG